MRRMLRIGFAQGVSSFLPILMWLLIGVVYQEKAYTNLFVITYAFQFVWGILYSGIIKGAKLYEKQHHLPDSSYYWSANILSFVLFVGIALCCIRTPDLYFSLLHMEVGTYYPFFVYGVLALAVNLWIAGVVLHLQFCGKEALGAQIMVRYYVLQVVSILLPRLFCKKEILCIAISLLVIISYALYITVKQVTVQTFYWNVFQGLRYRILALISNVGMLLIYGFGLGNVAGVSPLLLSSYNLMTLSTDTQWDMLEAGVETSASILVCEGTFQTQKHTLFKQSVRYSLLLLASSFGMMGIGSFFYEVDLSYLLLLGILEIGLLPVYAIRYAMVSWLSVKHMSVMAVVIALVSYASRTIISLGYQSPYSLSMGVFLSSSVLANGAFILLYKYTMGQEQTMEPNKQSSTN